MGLTLLLIILIAVFIAVLPAWTYSRNWGPFPAGLVGLTIFLLIVLKYAGMI